MDLKIILNILLTSPLSVLKKGIQAKEQEYYKKKIQSKYGIEQLPTIDLLDLFPDLNESINTYSFLSGTSLITDLLLLKLLAKKFNDGSYLEIGSWRGESLANVSEVLKDCSSLTLSSDEMRALNLGEEFIKVHGVFLENKESITKFEHNSHTFDFKRLGKLFDLIFVDGDHSYKGVFNDSSKVFPLRKNEKSIIVWHDYGNNMEDVRYTTLKGILDGIPKEKHKNLYHISNTLCAVYIEDNVLKTTKTKFPSFPNKIFSLKITGKKTNL